ncbi:MAG TPA: DsbC family protein [Rhodanobacteraceae bacterium]|nr:DsbC family protein [Rhodanobacteraceae bacterium]
MRNMKWVLVLMLAVSASLAQAGDGAASKAITEAIHKLVPKADVQAIEPAPIAGFSSAVVDGNVVYVSNDGRYLMQGKLFDLKTRTDLGATVLAATRAKVLGTIPSAHELRFPAKEQKYSVTVFTDVDCPYCRHFHAQIAEYNKRGIGVNYVLFPLEGLHPQALRKAQSVWCAKDRNATYTSAMAGSDPGSLTCDNPIADNLALGQRMGVNYTPTVLAPDGTEIPPGTAQSPDQLAALLASIAAKGG